MMPDFRVRAIEDISFHAPVKFYRNEPRTLRVETRIHSFGEELVADCRLIGTRSLPNQPEPQTTTHFTGRIWLTQEPMVEQSAITFIRPEDNRIDAADIYGVYFHGPAYQVIEKAWWNGSQVISQLAGNLPANHHPSELNTIMAPRLIELCFQTAGLWEMGVLRRMGLPRHVSEVRVLRDPNLASGAAVCCRHSEAGLKHFRRAGSRRKRNLLSPPLRLSDGRTSRRSRGQPLEKITNCLFGGRRRSSIRSKQNNNPALRLHMPNAFERVAIVNRGEAAMRFIHAAREYSQEQDIQLHTIALYTEPDRDALFVREADEAFALGAARFSDPETHLLKSSYLDYSRLEQALAATRADAVWVGWGFVAEHAAFADLCRGIGIAFLGPSGDVMRQLGDKIAAKRLAEHSGIPVAPWSGGPVETISDALAQARRLGFPLLIKAAAGGGGRGIRRVCSDSELEQALDSARGEAFRAFGDPTVFLERLVKGSRHIEVQIIADSHGTTWAVGARDCSVQRRQQKVIEEAPPPILSASDDLEMREAAVRIAKAAGYTSAGTVEFLFEPTTHQIWFMEVNTRLQVEHPVTECTTGLDLVKLQIHIARGGLLEGHPPVTMGHAIEVRLNAEDAEHGFAAAPGIVKRFRIVSGPGIRLDTGVAEDDRVPPDFDSMMAKLVGYGQTRSEALARLRRALHDSVIVVEGGASNRAFLTELLNRPEMETGSVDIGWLDHISEERNRTSSKYADVALIQAAIDTYEAGFSLEQAQFYASAARGRPHTVSDIGRTIALRYRAQLYSLRTFRLSPQDYSIEMDGRIIEAHVQRRDEFESWLTVFGRRFHVVSTSQGASSRIEVNGLSHCVDRDDWGMVHAPAPAVVVSVAVKPGDTVSLGDRLAVLEAMKMETQIVAPFSGKVRQVLTMPNVQVDAGTPLIQIEVTDRSESEIPENRISFGLSDAQANATHDLAQSRCAASLKQVRQLLLGFDVDPAATMRALSSWSQNCPAESEQLNRSENDILSIFLDICSLFHRVPNANHHTTAEEPAAETLFFSYLRMIETKGDGLPIWFVDDLQRVLKHYGVGTLESTPALKESLLWICKSHGRMDQHVAVVLHILERRLKHAGSARCVPDQEFRSLLDRLSAITQDPYPAISDLANEVRYRYFDQPSFERSRSQFYDEAEGHLAYLAAHGDAPDRPARIRALVECPQLLAGLFAGHFLTATPALRQTMLEVAYPALLSDSHLTKSERVGGRWSQLCDWRIRS